MARDYKYRAHKPRRKEKTGGRWLWLVTGYLLGAFSVGLAWLKLDSPGGVAEAWIGDRPTATGSGARAQVESPASRPPPKPRYDFYSMLPEMEVVVPPEEVEDLPVAAPPAADTGTPAVAGYLLQVGSFRSAADADRLKARLALLGLDVRVHRVDGGDGRPWHRVRCGPYRSTAQLHDVRRRLSENGIDSLVIRQSGDG